jgi:hypothetical protein
MGDAFHPLPVLKRLCRRAPPLSLSLSLSPSLFTSAPASKARPGFLPCDDEKVPSRKNLPGSILVIRIHKLRLTFRQNTHSLYFSGLLVKTFKMEQKWFRTFFPGGSFADGVKRTGGGECASPMKRETTEEGNVILGSISHGYLYF